MNTGLALAITLYLVTALVTFLFKPRTQAEYDAMPPRLSGALKVIAGTGIDGPKILDGLVQIVKGHSAPRK